MSKRLSLAIHIMLVFTRVFGFFEKAGAMDRKTDRQAGRKVMWTNRYAKVRLMGGWLEGGTDR